MADIYSILQLHGDMGLFIYIYIYNIHIHTYYQYTYLYSWYIYRESLDVGHIVTPQGGVSETAQEPVKVEPMKMEAMAPMESLSLPPGSPKDGSWVWMCC